MLKDYSIAVSKMRGQVRLILKPNLVKNMKKLKFLPAAMIITLAFGGTAYAETLTIRVETTSNTGTLRAAVYDSQSAFDADQMVSDAVGPAIQGTSVLVVENLKPGTYGIALFHDQNENGKLDTNLFGAPNEPFGFSNNPKIGFSAPKFDAFKFEFDGTPQDLNITLNGG